MKILQTLVASAALVLSGNAIAGFINSDGYLQEGTEIYGSVDTVLGSHLLSQQDFKNTYGNGDAGELVFMNSFVDPDYSGSDLFNGGANAWFSVVDEDSTDVYVVFELLEKPAHYIVKNAGGNRLAVQNNFDFGWGVLLFEDNSFFNSLGSDLTISHVTNFGDTPTDMPEPSVIALFGLGLLGMGAVSRRRKN